MLIEIKSGAAVKGHGSGLIFSVSEHMKRTHQATVIGDRYAFEIDGNIYSVSKKACVVIQSENVKQPGG